MRNQAHFPFVLPGVISDVGSIVRSFGSPPEILAMEARNGRKVYLTALDPPEVSSRGRRRKQSQKVSSPSAGAAAAASTASQWWATAEELIDRVGTEHADELIDALIEFADRYSEEGLESEESDGGALLSLFRSLSAPVYDCLSPFWAQMFGQMFGQMLAEGESEGPGWDYAGWRAQLPEDGSAGDGHGIFPPPDPNPVRAEEGLLPAAAADATAGGGAGGGGGGGAGGGGGGGAAAAVAREESDGDDDDDVPLADLAADEDSEDMSSSPEQPRSKPRQGKISGKFWSAEEDSMLAEMMLAE